MANQKRMIKVCQHDKENDHITGYDNTPCPGPQRGAKVCGCGAASTRSHPLKKPIYCRGPFNRTKFVD